MPTMHNAQKNLEKLQGGRVLVVGDVMLDAYLVGEAERISPEAPVPVVLIKEEKKYLGGAANVARNIQALGGQSTLMGLAGSDSAASTVQSLLQQEGIRDCLVYADNRPTTIKTRVLAQRQQMLRLDKEDSSPWDDALVAYFVERIAHEAADHEVIVLSDYAKGLVSKAFMEALNRELAKLKNKPQLLVDPKPQHMTLFGGADLLTPNAKETGAAANMPVRSQEEILQAGRHLLQRIGCKELLTTLGAQGMALFTAHGPVYHIPAIAQDVFDVTGAGDTVIATIALALASNIPLLEGCYLANHAAGIVVAKVGAATASPQEIAQSFNEHGSVQINVWA